MASGRSVEMSGAHRRMAEVAGAVGLERVLLLSMRDLDDPDAGGAEEHAHQVADHWSASGLDVTLRAAAVPGHPPRARRSGYEVIRRGGPSSVFLRNAAAAAPWVGERYDGLVEVSHGTPFFTPMLTRRPRVLFVHHVLQGVWHLQADSPLVARLGDLLERRVLAPVYRSTPLVVPSTSTKAALADLGVPEANISVAPNGVDGRFSPGGRRSPTPLVLAVGRLTPQKGFDVTLRAFARAGLPGTQLVVIGTGRSERELRSLAVMLGIDDRVTFLGRVPDDVLVDHYRRAWVVVNGSHREGWGLTLTEAAACGTPVVATRIPGHVDAVVDGVTGILADDEQGLAAALGRLVGDDDLRARMGRSAAERAAGMRWESVAETILRVLAADAELRAGHRARGGGRRPSRRRGEPG